MAACDRTGDKCNCTYSNCARRGNCCQCVAYHAPRGEFTACFFSAEGERRYDRTFSALVSDRGSLT